MHGKPCARRTTVEGIETFLLCRGEALSKTLCTSSLLASRISRRPSSNYWSPSEAPSLKPLWEWNESEIIHTPRTIKLTGRDREKTLHSLQLASFLSGTLYKQIWCWAVKSEVMAAPESGRFSIFWYAFITRHSVQLRNALVAPACDYGKTGWPLGNCWANRERSRAERCRSRVCRQTPHQHTL